MIDTDKYESMRRLFLDFIDTADEDTEDAWKNKLTMLDELLAEVKRLREQLIQAESWVWVEGGHIFETSEDRLKHYKEYIGDD